MAPKRKHQPSTKDGGVSESPYSKRPRRSGTSTNQSEMAQVIFDIVKDYEDENNHVVSETFMKLPSKRYHSDYYEKIVDPIDMNKIAQRIKTDEYRDIEILTTDIQLMTSNAKKYYEDDSQEFNDACALWEVYLNTKAKLTEGNKTPEVTKSKPGRKPKARPKTVDGQESDSEIDVDITIDDLKDLYDNLVTETDEEGRVIANMFMHLPDPANVQYYEIIKEPIDLVTIGEKLEEGKYKTIVDLKKDVLLLVKNAKAFNEPHSLIYRDAITIKNMFREKADILEKSKRPGFVGVKLSARVKNRKSFTVRGSERLHEKSLSRHELPDIHHELHDASILDPSDDDFQALLYNEVVNYKNQIGHTICDPFVRLPNKRFYPMYYDDIENPISLKMMRRKIQSKKYENCEEMAEDFSLLFSNAKQFNIGTSQIHRDASTLQKFMESKLPECVAKEEEDMEDASGSEDEDSNHAESTEKEDGEGVDGDRKIVDGDELVTPKKKRRRRKSAKESLQNRLHLLYNTLTEAEDDNGREMVSLFLEKPSRKDYPDYYKLVLEPIDMKMIEKKIRHGKYFNIEDMLEDFNLMFNNARHYNEPGSQVYSDADTLEKMLLTKNEELGPLPESELLAKTPRSSRKINVSDLDEKLEKLYSVVRDYIDPTNRMICEIFMHLPTKQVLPDYYKVIKKPIDMDRIQMRMQTGQYLKLDEMLPDLLLMFENACQYNEPGSLIYKDALILQKVAVDSYYEIEKVEDVLSPENLVQEMLTSLFRSVMNHQDESGRCYSETFSSQASSDETKEGMTVDDAKSDVTPASEGPNTSSARRNLTFEIIKKNLHNRRYRRLDVFQEHMFEVFEDARSKNRTDSEIYEDAIELQKFFIKIRDELCKNGETLLSPALSLTFKRLENEFEAEKKEKLPAETKEDKMNDEAKDLDDKLKDGSQSEGVTYQGTVYKPADFVYIDNPDNPSSPHIVNIVKLYKDEAGQDMLYGVWLYRPEATFHMASKKFFVKEVFKSDYYNAVSISLVQGKCFVMLSKDYFKLRPVGFKEEDVYVTESRYSSKSKSFKRLKLNQWPHNRTELVPRDASLPVIRISSCYSEQKIEDPSPVDKMKNLLMEEIEESWPTDVIDVDRKNIEAEGIVAGETKHYIQYGAKNMWFKIGDCVYLRQENTNLPRIVRIERLWTDGSNKSWFEGPWFIKPDDSEHEPTRTFYKKELFISCSEATFSFDDVIGKCVVLFIKDYFACRPTEVAEDNVHLFESKYFKEEKMIKKIKSAKRYAPSFKAVDDEYYYYKRPLASQTVVSPILLKVVQAESDKREKEATLMKTKQEPEVIATVPGEAPAFPQAIPTPTQVYPQPVPVPVYVPNTLVPGQPYPHYPHQVVPSYPVPGVQGVPHHPPAPPHPYVQQAYPPVARYPSPLPGMPPQHVPPYQNAPQVYPSSPHVVPPHVVPPHVVPAHPPASMAPSMMQSPDSSRPPSAKPEVASTPPTTTKRRGRSGHSTGYILFASHCHPRVRSENPDLPFGDISKIVGEEWRKLDEERKREFEEKAKEQTARAEAEGRLVVKKKKKKKDVEEPPPTPQTPVQHIAPIPQQYPPHPTGQYPGTPDQAYMGQRMPMAQHPGAVGQYPASSYVQTPVGPAMVPHQVVPTPPPPPPTVAQLHRRKRGPLYVKPPPKAQRVMHSEAYLRYIEGLEKGSKSVSNWEKTLSATEKNIKITKEEELPLHWLGSGKGRHENATAALWSLRNLMLKDALTIKNNFN